MKIRKPEDEKYFKDIVLNNILDEISSETGAPSSIETKKKVVLKRTLLLKGLALLFTILIVIALFTFSIDSTKKEVKEKVVTTPTQTEIWRRSRSVKVTQKAIKRSSLEEDEKEHTLAKEALKRQISN